MLSLPRSRSFLFFFFLVFLFCKFFLLCLFIHKHLFFTFSLNLLLAASLSLSLSPPLTLSLPPPSLPPLSPQGQIDSHIILDVYRLGVVTVQCVYKMTMGPIILENHCFLYIFCEFIHCLCAHLWVYTPVFRSFMLYAAYGKYIHCAVFMYVHAYKMRVYNQACACTVCIW